MIRNIKLGNMKDSTFICIILIILLLSLGFMFKCYGSSSNITEYNGEELYYIEAIDDNTSVFHLSPNTKMTKYDYYKIGDYGKVSLIIETREMKEDENPEEYTVSTTMGQVFIIKETKQ